MLLVPTYVAPSSIEGLGLFAAAPIAKGTTVWRFDPLLDLVFPEGLLAGYPPGTQAFLRKYGYPPDKQAKATETVMQQAELLCADWAA